MDELSSFYESLELGAIRQLIAEKRTEDLHLEFKTLNPGSFDRDGRRNLARCMSGFANSDGGVVVWGVEARRNADDLDCAQSECLISNLDVALSQLQTLTGQGTSPLVDGITHRAIPADGDAGFIATLVPASDCQPHMAKLGEDRYYKRSGGSFYRMEHFDLEDMFGRRKRPVLQFDARPTRSSTMGTQHAIAVVVGIANKGRGIARFPSLELEVQAPHALCDGGLDGNYRTGLPKLVRAGTEWRRPIFAGGVDDVIHVGCVREVTRLEPILINAANRVTQDITMKYRILAEGMLPVEGTYVLLAGKILAMLGD
jgi:hypothetical protein